MFHPSCSKKSLFMPRIAKPLTDTEIRNAKSKDAEYSLVDGKGLKLRIAPSGSKSWLLNYRKPATGKRTNLGLGSYPSVTLSMAREKRQAALSLLSNDQDPKEHRDKKKKQAKLDAETTLLAVAKDWFEVKKTEVTPDYADDVWRSLENHVFPLLGHTPIAEVNAPNTIPVIRPLEAGSRETLRRVCQRLNEIMTYAVNTGAIHANPLAGIKEAFKKPAKEHLRAIKPEDLPEFMTALAQASIRKETRCLIEWQLHTMVRAGEAVQARWDDIDLSGEIPKWTIPKEVMKMKRPHEVPLSHQSLAILEEIKPITGHREFVFASPISPKKHMNPSTVNVAIKRMDWGRRLVAHGFRTIASTTLNDKGFDFDLVEAALAHVDKNDVRAAYNRASYIKRRYPMMQFWSDFIEECATGNVVQLVGAKHLDHEEIQND